MRACLLFLVLILSSPVTAQTRFQATDSYIMGAGSWTCDEIGVIAQLGDPSDFGQFAGWVLGVWSLATSQRDKGFTDVVQQVGGRKIIEATVAECSKAPPSTLLYRVVYRMIDNTNPQN